MLYPSLDPNERFRDRRADVRRRKRRRRALLVGVVLLVLAGLVGGMTMARKSGEKRAVDSSPTVTTLQPAAAPKPEPRPLPVEIRGIHVTGALMTLKGRYAEYLGYTKHGLNTIELDVKDEGGIVNFIPAGVPLALESGAARPYYKPREAVAKAHDKGVYLIGRVVVFQDPVLASHRPDLAVKRPDGSIWATGEGLAWVNPYDRRVWDYAVSIAEAAARAGFDEIMLDYVRFPSDGDVASAVYPGRTTQPRGRLIADFVAYAKRRLDPLGVRVSAAVFGLSATRDLGIGQRPQWLAVNLDHVNPMSYPALYGGGELGLASPSREPGETVFRTLADFRSALADSGSKAQLIPWVQDWNYSPGMVRQQIEALRLQGAKGYLLWNAAGVYTRSALAPPA